jgi:hypothetical protein
VPIRGSERTDVHRTHLTSVVDHLVAKIHEVRCLSRRFVLRSSQGAGHMAQVCVPSSLIVADVGHDNGFHRSIHAFGGVILLSVLRVVVRPNPIVVQELVELTTLTQLDSVVHDTVLRDAEYQEHVFLDLRYDLASGSLRKRHEKRELAEIIGDHEDIFISVSRRSRLGISRTTDLVRVRCRRTDSRRERSLPVRPY